MKEYIKIVFISFIAIFLISGCGIDDKLVQKHKDIQEVIKKSKKSIVDTKTKYEKFVLLKEFQDFNKYAKKEKWSNSFQNANNVMKSIENNNKTLTLMIQKNDSDDEKKVINYINYINKDIKKINQILSKPFQRFKELLSLKQNFDKNYKNYLIKLNTIEKKKNSHFLQYDSIKEKYPTKIDDLIKKEENINKQYIIIKENINQYQLMKNKQIKIDYSKIDIYLKEINQYYKDILKDIEFNNKVFKELDKSYSKILIDQKQQYFIKVGRVSWNNNSDWNTEKTVYTPLTQVSKQVYESVINNTNTIASTDWTGKSIKINKNIWRALKPNTRLPSNHDSAEWWIEDGLIKYFHKYQNIENNQKVTTNWIEVSEDYFYKYQNNVGMEIMSKPYGYYESEMITEASPVGINYVGNKRYGEWRNDNSGHSFWYYYGLYSFFNGNNHYSRNEYSNYRNNYQNKRPYYGSKTTSRNTILSNDFKNRNKDYMTTRMNNSTKLNKESLSHKPIKRTNTSRKSSSSLRGVGSKTRGRGASGGGK